MSRFSRKGPPSPIVSPEQLRETARLSVANSMLDFSDSDSEDEFAAAAEQDDCCAGGVVCTLDCEASDEEEDEDGLVFLNSNFEKVHLPHCRAMRLHAAVSKLLQFCEEGGFHACLAQEEAATSLL